MVYKHLLLFLLDFFLMMTGTKIFSGDFIGLWYVWKYCTWWICRCYLHLWVITSFNYKKSSSRFSKPHSKLSLVLHHGYVHDLLQPSLTRALRFINLSLMKKLRSTTNILCDRSFAMSTPYLWKRCRHSV